MTLTTYVECFEKGQVTQNTEPGKEGSSAECNATSLVKRIIVHKKLDITKEEGCDMV